MIQTQIMVDPLAMTNQNKSIAQMLRKSARTANVMMTTRMALWNKYQGIDQGLA
jgi:hypothetical protein